RLDILVPLALPPAELKADLLKQLRAPALATLAARARLAQTESFDGFPHALPHEYWITRRAGLHAPADNSPAVAGAWMHAHDIAAEEGTWFALHPVHIHIARDHLVLTDPQQLDLSDADSRTLFDIARPLFEEYGHALHYGNATTWFMRADQWQGLRTSTPEAAAGHNVDLWLPRGPGERDWRRLQNEVQMHWFTHPLNEAREARGARPVNSLWLWGAAQPAPPPRAPWQAAFNLGRWPYAAPGIPMSHATDASTLLAQRPEHVLLALDALIDPAIAGDWGDWLAALEALERDWFAPLLEALRSGSIDEITLVPTGEGHLKEFVIRPSSLRKFWVRPSLNPLFA
ncbi:MAG TPA: hypothetical protein VM406_11680, partial [Noviherbaspirillum sp.]|nr:hypothetical protein [Noviherbaspirillum sp.]